MPDSLAEIVLEEALLSAEAIAKAADSADQNRLPLVVPLVREQGVDEVALLAALKKHVRISTLDPSKVAFDTDALRELSLDEARRLRVLPLSIGIYGSGPKLLRVATPDPTDTICLTELEHLTGCTIEPTLVTLSAVEEMIEAAYKTFVTEVMKRGKMPKAPNSSETQVSEDTAPDEPAPESLLALQLEALIAICIDKELFSRAEYEGIVRELIEIRDKKRTSSE